ncbi:MAG: hypothetical protein ABI379_04005 [Rhodanobacter sp.]
MATPDAASRQASENPAGPTVYPSSSLHRVASLTRGARIASLFRVQSLIRDDAQRRMLFDLDLTIQRLTQNPASNQDTVLSLTIACHNLLRQWAES